ncbi:MAG: SsrA-binding protein SmpB [Rickettsiales bacterium]|jgi:SsrA-binding protein|nr:SsrA-binding protein SmpB [Rickettsiales bacterium]
MVDNYRIISQNRKARYEYFIEEEYEAGLVLEGDEIKSIRSSGVSIQDAHVEFDKSNELYIHNLNIAPYKMASAFSKSEPNRKKKLLLRRKEINRIGGKIRLRGFTCVPLVLYLNSRNYAKIKIAVVKGKKLYDKRESIREREIKREELRTAKMSSQSEHL